MGNKDLTQKESEKKTYMKPLITEFGSMVKITQSGSTSTCDGGGAMNGGTWPCA